MADEPIDRARVLIVVPTLNEARTIEAVVTRLLDGTEALRTDLVVVDGNSVDGTRDIVRRIAETDPRVRLVANPARIQSAGINLAVSVAGSDADYLIRADAHATYPVGFCASLIEEARRTGASSVTVPMVAEAGLSNFQAGVAVAQNSVLGTGGSAHRTGGGGRFVDHGHHALFRASAFREVGGYDPEFSHNEDAELDRRLTLAGHRIWLSDRIEIVYYPRPSASALFRQYQGFGRGRARMLLKHRLIPKLRQTLPLLVPVAAVLGLAGLALAAATGNWIWLYLLAPLALWAAICMIYGVILAIRDRSFCAAWAGPAAIVMHLAWGIGFFRELTHRLEWHSPISKTPPSAS